MDGGKEGGRDGGGGGAWVDGYLDGCIDGCMEDCVNYWPELEQDALDYRKNKILSLLGTTELKFVNSTHRLERNCDSDNSETQMSLTAHSWSASSVAYNKQREWSGQPS